MSYDMSALYLYDTGYRFEIGAINRIYEKSIKMTSGHRIKKEDWDYVYKLTEEEANCYRGELIKKLSQSRIDTERFLKQLIQVRKACQSSPLVEVNTSKLQETVDKLEIVLTNQLPSTIVIRGEKFKFEDYSTELRKVTD